MSLLKTTALFGTLALIGQVSAHGIVTGVVADGKYFQGYDPSFKYQQTPPEVAGWTAPLTEDRGFVSPSAFGSPDIICHKGATPGKAYITVSAGGTIDLQWTTWHVSHHGPVMDYLAPCGDDCTTVDKTKLQWTKIDEAGLNEWVSQPGDWASDDLIANNNTWSMKIPSSIAPGKYVLRHEIIALHSANNPDGAQNYPQCMNIEVTGSGSNDLSSGTLGTELYTATDPGILINIYYPKVESYDIPGPEVMAGGSSGSPAPSPSTAPSSSSPADISVTGTPPTNIAIPSGEQPPSTSPTPSSPTPAPSSEEGTPDSQTVTTAHWSDWSYTDVPTDTPAPDATPSGTTTTTTTVDEVPPTDTPAETPAPTETSAPSEGPGAGWPYPSPPAGGEETPAPTEAAPPAETPAPSEAAPPAPPSPTTPPVSFSSTVTGRIGKPTRFVCYVEED
jgi:hypothetical protein